MDAFSHKGAAAVLTAQEASIPQDTLIRSGPDISLFPFRQQYLSLLPNFSGYNGREEVLVPKLLLRLGKAEGLVDLVALTFVANQRTIRPSQRYFFKIPSWVFGVCLFISPSCVSAGVFRFCSLSILAIAFRP